MSLIVRDSFDAYQVANDLLFTWDSSYTADTVFFNISTTTRFGVGQAMWTRFNLNNTAVFKRFGSTQRILFAVFAMMPAGLQGTATEDYTLRFFESGTTQCSIVFCSNGDIRVYRGDARTGANKVLLQTFTATFSGLVWTHWQVKVIIDNTTGEVHIRKNGNTVDDYAVTGIDLAVTANNYADSFDLGSYNSGIDHYTDDLVLYSGDGLGAPWNDWVGDIRAETIQPSGDTAQIDFVQVNGSTILGSQNNVNGGGGQSANQLNFFPVTAGATGVLQTNGSIIFFTTPGAGKHFMLALYDSDGVGGKPGTLLASGAAVATGAGSAGQYLQYSFTLSNTVNITTQHTYFWALVSDAGHEVARDTPGAGNYYRATFTYGTAFPSTAPVTSNIGGVSVLCISAPIGSVTNSSLVSEPIFDRISKITAGNVNDYDLYDITGMTNTPSAIYGVSVRLLMAKTDADLREATATVKSGSTQVDGRTINLGTDWQLYDFPVDLDPATGLPWTAAAVNNLSYGPKVVA